MHAHMWHCDIVRITLNSSSFTLPVWNLLRCSVYFKFLDMFDDLREKAKLLHAELEG